jgi:hypothetical protein
VALSKGHRGKNIIKKPSGFHESTGIISINAITKREFLAGWRASRLHFGEFSFPA